MGIGALAELAARWPLRHDYLRGRVSRPVVGYISPSTPVELIYAAGLHPVRLFPEADAGDLADQLLQRAVCPYLRSLLGEAQAGRYAFLAGLVQPHACDNQVKTFEVWQREVRGPFYLFLNTPHVAREANRAFYLQELTRLQRCLAAETGQPASADDLQRALAVYNRQRELLRRLSACRAADPPRLTGAAMLLAVLSGFYLDPLEHCSLLARLLSETAAGSGRVGNEVGIRVHLTGTVYANLPLLELLAECGLEVVSDDLSAGAGYHSRVVQPGVDLLAALADHYLGLALEPYIYHAAPLTRAEWSLGLAQQAKAAGVVAYFHDYCDPEKMYFMLARRRFEAAGLPVLALNGEYTAASRAQFAARLAAFADLLREGGE